MILFIIISIIINPFLIINNNLIIYTSLLTLVLTYKKLDKDNYILISVITGLIYDIFYSTYIINIFIYLILSLIIKLYFEEKEYKLKNVIIVSMFIIFSYNSIYYLILNIFNEQTFGYIYFITNLIFIYLVNIIYVSLLYLFIKNKKH